MALSEELISQLVKVTNDRGRGNTDYTVYGTIVTDGTRNYVQIDGSDVSTPVETTVEITPGDRVIVEVKNHIATVTGNTTDPAIGVKTADGIRSSITQTADQIRAEIVDEVNGLESSITQNADKIETVVKNQNEFSQFQQTVEGFSFLGKGGTVKISGGDINLSGAISFSDLRDSSTIKNQINNAVNAADDAADVADAVDETLTKLLSPYDKTTYIDGSKIVAESLYVDRIKLGEWMKVHKSLDSSAVGGYFGYTEGFNSTYGIGMRAGSNDSMGQCVCTDLAARLSYGPEGNNNAQVVASNSGALYLEGQQVVLGISGSDIIQLYNGGSYHLFRPYSTSTNVYLGAVNHRWLGVYAQSVYADTCTGTTSDRNEKHSIEDLPEKYITLFNNLRPVRYKLNDGTSNRYHVGYVAQEVEEAMLAAGIDSQEFGGFVREIDENGREMLMLRYGEFDAIRDAKIKQLEARVEALEKRLDSLGV